MNLSVIGLGRVGLPLALAFASKGVDVTGMDINDGLIAQLKQKKMPFTETGAQEILHQKMGSGFSVTTNMSEAMKADNIVLTLGTPVDEYMNPDYSQIEAVLGNMIPHLHSDQLIILRSTVSPGTINYVKDFIEEKTKFRIGKDLFLAFCPERLAEGKAIKEIFELPEIVGTLDEKSAKRAEELFKKVKAEVYKTTAVNAELLKLFTNMYRYINFAIANEFMIVAEQFGGDIYEIVKLANTNYPRGGPAKPGFTAGPCLFKDGFFLTNKIPFPELISAAWKINETIPYYLVERLKEFRPIRGANIGVLGLGFKADNDDTRASLSHKLIKILEREGAKVRVHDTYAKDGDLEKLLSGLDVLIIATAHKQYRDQKLEYYRKFVKKDCVFIDIWNVFGKNSIIFRGN